MRSLKLPSPTAVIALLALFFALGGSAFAVGQATSASQPRCAQGAIRGIAVVIGAGTIPNNVWSTNAAFFARKWNCAGKGVQVRRIDAGIYDVRFVGNSSNAAVVSSADKTSAAVTRNQDGSFRVTIFTAEDNDHQQLKGDGAFQMIIV